MPKRKTQPEPVPHSWAIESWPSHVYPHSPSRARYTIKSNRTALIGAGALTRIGRDLVILGGPYCRWVEAQTSRVEGYRGGCIGADAA